MRHITVDPQQFIAMAQPLALRINEQQDGPLGVIAHDLENFARHSKGEFNTNRRGVDRADHRDDAPSRLAGTGEIEPIEFYSMSCREKLIEKLAGVHF
jgi:hypothetical protein